MLAKYSSKEFETITIQQEGGIAVIYLSRPPRNAWTAKVSQELIEAYEMLDGDDAVKVIIVTGSDNKAQAFCAGADLAEGDFSTGSSTTGRSGSQSTKHPLDHRDAGGQTVLASYKMRKPTIAAINGHAVGIGITMTLSLDIRIVWKDAKIGFVFAKRGIVPEATSTFFLPRLIGHARALEIFLRARVLPASDPSYDLLFSERIDERSQVLNRALEMAREMCQLNSALSMASIKALVWHGHPTAEEQHLLDSQAMALHGNSNDGKEGVKSFMEKRAVNFTGSIPKDDVMRPWWSRADVRGPAPQTNSKSKL